ncbi:MAG: hypothetical protein IIB44_13080 [Candidatus Marinimicrobia bacterium]|nr:hypothetical protein [Candidatus Neomarinimicrobiota bacterium]
MSYTSQIKNKMEYFQFGLSNKNRDRNHLEQNGYIKAVREGDHEANKNLVNMLEPVVASTILGMLGQCPEVDDVGQETFIRLYQ